MVLFTSSQFASHVTPPGHPERPERAAVFSDVARAFADRGGLVHTPRPATREALARVHTAGHVDRIASTAGRATMLDPDTFTSPDSYDVALLAVGAAIDAARHAWQTGEAALALVRPPGHHAEPNRAMGFCLFNNIAIAAATLRAEGASRVAILDFDVHHGNGTQEAFYADPTVFYGSSHQYPYYPGTGAADEVGAGPGRGSTLNAPLSAGATDADVLAVYEETLLPAVEAFRPEVLLVSAGYDAHEDDPLGGLRMTTAGFAALLSRIRAAADRTCGGRLAYVTEGGYDLAALEACLAATIE